MCIRDSHLYVCTFSHSHQVPQLFFSPSLWNITNILLKITMFFSSIWTLSCISFYYWSVLCIINKFSSESYKHSCYLYIQHSSCRKATKLFFYICYSFLTYTVSLPECQKVTLSTHSNLGFTFDFIYLIVLFFLLAF